MPSIASIRRELGIDPGLVLAFFLSFSRFEYALKRSPAYVKRGKHGAASADWTAFANAHSAAFDPQASPRLREAFEYLDRHPPGIQVATPAGALSWRAPNRNGQSDLAWAIRHVQAARNNLFHGGKFPRPVGPVEDSARNTVLLTHCLTILRSALELDPNVKMLFEESFVSSTIPLAAAA